VSRNNRRVKLSAGNEAYLRFYLNKFTDIESLRKAVHGIPYCSGDTNLTGALRLTRTEIFNAVNGDRSRVRNVLILITDGNPTREINMLDAEVRRIKSLGVRIVGVGVTNEVSECDRFFCFHSRVKVNLTCRLLDLHTKPECKQYRYDFSVVKVQKK